MIKIVDKHTCCGCGACVQRCPKQCISLVEDAEGFLYPHVNQNDCIDCGLCEKVCSFIHPYEKRTPLQTLAAINTNEGIRMQSSSGGIFTLLAEKVIDAGGVVFGARYDDDWQVVLDYTETKEGLAAFRGSKYVQARTKNTFQECEQFLKENRKVLYSGTPCQISGLKHYLRKEYNNLLTVDFICHGVPSPLVWQKYLAQVVGENEIKSISMRDKSKEGWKRYYLNVDFKQGDSFSSIAKTNIYMNAFLNEMILRPSCYQCKVKECRSFSDITIGDYWGITAVRPQMDDDKGTGLVLIHTAKGQSAIDMEKLRYAVTTFEEGYRHNPAIYRSPKPWFRREQFFAQLHDTDDVIALMKKNLEPTLKMKVEKFVYRFITKIKSAIKRVVKL